ncbi:flavoprotein [Streptomyces sp. NBC_00287]|uniref:flavoprotein n=1 Tax=Streptomyces sp. NBC_00287 TaxID=2975702 RepID=UPI002E2CCBA0|nr:flavoprotein [Streptomyces sp. NBC_00287]
MADLMDGGAQDGVAGGPAPAFGARKVLFVGTGAMGVMFMPMWVNWVRTAYPDIELRCVVTRSAERFVTRGAITAFAGAEVLRDVWSEEPETGAPHVDLAHWADAVVVHPATFHFVSRFALGIADTPVLLALQCTSAPIGIAPALPPGGVTSPAYRRHVEALEQRPNVVVVPPQPGFSVTTGRMDASVATPPPEVFRAVEELRGRMSGAGGAGASPRGGAAAGVGSAQGGVV